MTVSYPKPQASATGQDRDALIRKAGRMSLSRAIEAEATHPFYELLEYDPETGRAVVATQQRDARGQRREHTVNLNTFECSCPDYTERLVPLNRELEAAGLCPSLTCKHGNIALAKIERGIEPTRGTGVQPATFATAPAPAPAPAPHAATWADREALFA